MKRILYPILVIVSLLTVGCGDKADDPTPPVEPDVDPVSRTVLVYMVADNSLGNAAFDVADLREMMTAIGDGALNGGRLLAYWNCVQTEGGIPPRLFEVTADGIKELKRYPDDTSIYSVDPERISEVMTDFKSYAPADEYGIIFWSHANGWLGAPSDAAGPKYRAFGDDRGYHITLPSLAGALEGQQFAFIYFDCCLMGNIETVYELRRFAPVIAASPTELGVEGMPYDQTLRYFFLPEPDVVGAARTTFERYSSNGMECQLAVYSTAGLDRLAEESRTVISAATDPFTPEVNSLQRYVKPRDYNSSVDMRDYYDLLGATASWHTAFDSVVLWKAATRRAIGDFTVDPDAFCGLGSHAPRSESDLNYRGYADLAWCKYVWGK
ncbi:MAG: hypothetical protein J1E29_07410 [Duncaniella sp.]|nr:hypothetical protein [Duncaniella sp.]